MTIFSSQMHRAPNPNAIQFTGNSNSRPSIFSNNNSLATNPLLASTLNHITNNSNQRNNSNNSQASTSASSFRASPAFPRSSDSSQPANGNNDITTSTFSNQPLNCAHEPSPFHSFTNSKQPFFIPYYLKNTRIVDMYQQRAFSLQNSGSSVDSEKGWAFPTFWDPNDKCSLLDLSHDSYQVNYNGSGIGDSDAGAVRANFPIPSFCGIYYYEVEIIDKGADGYIGVGFCGGQVPLNRLPGWEPFSWGYHGDDGHSFCCSGTGKTYGPTFTTGDIIGCCINLLDNTAFFTKNGCHLGIAFNDIRGKVFPTVGLRTVGEKVYVNFGQQKFKFDIEEFVKDQKEKLFRKIDMIHPRLEKRNFNQESGDSVNELVLSYLIHHGYSDTAKTFSKDIETLSEKSEQQEDVDMDGGYQEKGSRHQISALTDIKNRQQIRYTILNGDIDSAINLLHVLYPSVLEENETLYFRLRCRKFIELIPKHSVVYCDGDNENNRTEECCGDYAMKMEESHTPFYHLPNINSTGGLVGDALTLSKNKSALNKGRRKRELSEGSHQSNISPTVDAPGMSISTDQGGLSKEAGLNDSKEAGRMMYQQHRGVKYPTASPYQGLGEMKEALIYGQQLYNKYKDHASPEIRKMLMDTFSILAYPDPLQSVMAPLLHPSSREPLANDMNSAILVSQHLPSSPPLENIFRQSCVVVQEMLEQNVAEAALINPIEDCLLDENIS